MDMLKKSITKSVSVLLSLIMMISLFTVIQLPVGAEGAEYTLTVDYFEPGMTDDHYDNIALETKIDGSSAEGEKEAP